MASIGLKLWNPNTDIYLAEACALYRDNIFDFIELYIVPGYLDKINEWQNTGIPINLHAPHFAHGMNLSVSQAQAHNMKLYGEVKEYANALKPEYIIFHAGTDGDYKETARQLFLIDDSRAVIENKPLKTLPEINGSFYVGSRPQEIKYIMQTAKCRFCLDIGHAISAANAQGIEPYGYIENFMTLKPTVFHLSDINTASDMDQHYGLGQGTLDFQRLLSIIGTDQKILIETDKKSQSNLDDFVQDVRFLRGVIRNAENT